LGFDIHEVQITNFSPNFHKIVATTHNVKILFTKFTFLFTIQIRRAEKHQGRFAESILKGSVNKKV